jgi:hypothetical protein
LQSVISASYWLLWTFVVSEWSKEAQQGRQVAISDVKIISVSYWSLWPFLTSDWSKEAAVVSSGVGGTVVEGESVD